MNPPFFARDSGMLLKISAITLCLGGLYYPVLAGLIRDWLDMPDFSHGFFIPLLSLYFVWERSERMEKLQISPANSGLVVVLTGLFLLFVGNLAAEHFIMRLSMIVVLSGITLFLLGWRHLRLLIFPIGFLLLMVPLPSILMQKITFPMQLFASQVAAFSLQLLNIPVFREGNIICLANTSLEVAEACSGIRSLISLLATSIVFAYFTKNLLWQRIVLILASFPLAILVNAFRVSATGVLTHYFGVQVAQGFYHDFSGYLLFLVSLTLLVGIGFVLSWFDRGSHPSDARKNT